MLNTLLNWVAARGLYVMGGGVFAGYALPDAAHAVAPALPYAIAGMMTVSMMRVRGADLATELRRWPMLAAATSWLLLLSPLLTWLLLSPLPLDPTVRLALILTAACPPLMSTVGLSWMMGMSPALALAVVIGATLASPLTLALALDLAGNPELSLQPLSMFLRLSLLIGSCYAAAAVLRKWLGAARIERSGALWDILTVALLLLFAVAVMDGVAARASSEPRFVLMLLAIGFAINLVLQLAGYALGRKLGVSGALTLAFASGNRAVGLLLAVAPGNASNDLVLFFALYQVPMYTLPFMLRPVYAWRKRRART